MTIHVPPEFTDQDTVRGVWVVQNYLCRTAGNIDLADEIDFRAWATMEIVVRTGAGRTFNAYTAVEKSSDGGAYRGPKQYYDNVAEALVAVGVTVSAANIPTSFPYQLYDSAFIKIIADAEARVDLVFKS